MLLISGCGYEGRRKKKTSKMALLVVCINHGSETMQSGSHCWVVCAMDLDYIALYLCFFLLLSAGWISVLLQVVPKRYLSFLVVQSTWPIKFQFHTWNQPSRQRCSFIYIYSFKCHNGLEYSFLFLFFHFFILFFVGKQNKINKKLCISFWFTSVLQ